VSGKPRSVRQAQAQHAAQLRAEGRTWAEIGVAFQVAYRVNPRVALRQAHGWSQPQAAEEWTRIWPDDPKTFKNFSYWEQWPGKTGHAPSLETLDKLARLYRCKVTDLLSDCRDYSGRAAVLTVRERAAASHAVAASQVSVPAQAGPGQARDHDQFHGHVPADRAPGPPGAPGWSHDRARGGLADRSHQVADDLPADRVPAVSSAALQAALETIRRAQITQLIQAGNVAEEPGPRLRRRTLLLEASSALAVVAAAPVLEVPRLVTGSRSGRHSPDVAIVQYTSDVVAGLRRLGGTVGPRITLQPAMSLRSAMSALARSVPSVVTSQALTAYGDLTQLIGWLLFNLGDHKAAWYYYDDARAAAYRAGDNDLASYTLAASSQLAAARRRPGHAVDHAQAAIVAAKASGSSYAMAYAADVAARAYAEAGQLGRCQAALDREQEALVRITDDTPRSPWWYFYDRSFYWGTEAECALKFDLPVDASDAARRALGLVAPVNCHNSALTLAYRAEALIKQGEYSEACDTLADSARLTTLNSSRRISSRIHLLRQELHVADGTSAVRELDEKLAEYRKARTASEATVPA
jgi:tetratricopeptide (TPR) repeat protein